jgi:hypothetical protein
MKRLALGFFIMLAACYNPDSNVTIDAANALTRNAAKQRLKAYAAGNDCQILLVRAKTTIDDAGVETLHYGTGESPVYPGGLQQFAEERKFRAVVYKDSESSLWTYGSTTREEAQTMPVCR